MEFSIGKIGFVKNLAILSSLTTIIYYNIVYIDMIVVNALKVRTKLGGILDNVAKNGEHYLIERMGKPMAVIVPYQSFDMKTHQSQTRRERIQKIIDSIDLQRQKNLTKYSTQDSAKIVRRMRDERSKHLLDVVEDRQ